MFYIINYSVTMLHITFIILAFIVVTESFVVYPKLFTSTIQNRHLEILDLDKITIELIPNEYFLFNHVNVFINDQPSNHSTNCRYLKGFDTEYTAVSICDNTISGIIFKDQEYYTIEPRDEENNSHELQLLEETLYFPQRKKRDIGVVCGTTSFDDIKIDENVRIS